MIADDFHHFPKQMHVRDPGENNEKLVILIQHGNNLYEYIKTPDQKGIGKQIKFSMETSKESRFFTGINDTLFFLTGRNREFELFDKK